MAAVNIPRDPAFRHNKLRLLEAQYTEPPVSTDKIAAHIGCAKITLWKKLSKPDNATTDQVMKAIKEIREIEKTSFSPLIR